MKVPLSFEKPGGPSLSYGERDLYPGVNPQDLPRAKVSALTVPAQTLVLIPSPLLGYGVAELLPKIPASSFILALELNPDLAGVSQRFARSVEHPRWNYLHLPSSEAVLKTVDRLGLHRFRRTLLVPLHGGVALHSQQYRSLQELLDRQIRQYWKNRITLIHMGSLWLRNLLQNLPQTAQARPFLSFSTELPIVCAAAGPSLEKDIPRIQSLRPQIFLMCADTALEVLLAHGLIPDAVVAMEAQWWNLRDFVGAQGRGIPLLCDLTAHPQTARALGGPLAFFCSRFAPVEILERLEALGFPIPFFSPLGNVGNTMVRLARLLTQAPILLTGLDFSFRPGKSHAKGAPFFLTQSHGHHRLWPQETGALTATPQTFPAVNGQGETVFTHEGLKSYREVFRSFTQNWKDLYAMNGEGLDLGLPRFTGFGTGFVTGELKPSSSPARIPSQDFFNSGAARESLRGWLAGEKEKIEKLMEGIQGVNQGSASAESLLPLLKPLDYLWCNFPDTEEVPNLTSSFLIRVLWSAKFFLGRLQSSGEDLRTDKKAP